MPWELYVPDVPCDGTASAVLSMASPPLINNEYDLPGLQVQINAGIKLAVTVVNSGIVGTAPLNVDIKGANSPQTLFSLTVAPAA